MTVIPVCLTREAYTYSREHRHKSGWNLFDELDWPTIRRLDEASAFGSDAEAAFHVLCAAAFDATREGAAAREALRKIVRFGEQGRNPIATMLAPRRQLGPRSAPRSPDAFPARNANAPTHVLISGNDLAVLERELGHHHPITRRVREGLEELSDPELAKYRAAARRHAREGELEIDPGAPVSKGGDPGAYVMAWLWVDDEEARISAP